MSRSRRLTGTIVSLLLLPATVGGGGSECAMPFGGSGDARLATAVTSSGHSMHGGAHSTRNVDVATAAQDGDGRHSPAGGSHGPMECLSVTACTGAALVVASVQVDGPSPRDARVAAETPLAPL